jgi:hypothetical protein
MAPELGLNPAKLGKIDNHKQEPWKLPLPRFIEQLYFERFGKTTPDNVASIEERCRVEGAQREARRAARQQRASDSTGSTVSDGGDMRRCGPRCCRAPTRGGDVRQSGRIQGA